MGRCCQYAECGAEECVVGGSSLQGVEGDCGADGDYVDNDADGRCDQDGVDGDAQGRVHFREGVWEGVAAVACECPGGKHFVSWMSQTIY